MSDEDGPTLTDTGLVAAAVTMNSAPEAPVEPTPAAPPARVQIPDGWTLPKVAMLVTDVAQNMYDTPYILKKHGLNAEQFDYLQKNIFFQRALEAETITWHGTNSIQKRLALEAAIAVENAMPQIAARLLKPTEPLTDVVALLKVLSEIAGTIGAKAAAQPQGPTDRFKIIINLGGDITTREASVTAAVRPEPEGASPTQALQKLVGAT